MKFKMADTEILFEALRNGSQVKGRKGNLICSFVGSIEMVIGEDYETECYLAVQLPSGEILGLDSHTNTVFSIRKYWCTVHWNFYPVDFPDELKTTRPCPTALRPRYEVKIDCSTEAAIEPDDLPI